MTSLERPVIRRTRNPCPTTRRRWIVELRPGDILQCREEGRRKRYMAPLSRVCVQVAKWNAEADRSPRKTVKVKRGYNWR